MRAPSIIAAAALAITVSGCALRQTLAVEKAEYVEVDGARLYLEVRGSQQDAPVLLWLHGGPGGPERPLFRYFNGELEGHFIVAYLDQRGAGRSFDPSADRSRLTIGQHMADLDRIVEHLRTTLHADKLILVGHSWGSTLGLSYAASYPDKVAVYIGVSQVISTLAQQDAEYAFVQRTAAARRDTRALAKLAEIGRPPLRSSQDVIALQRLSDQFPDPAVREPNRGWVLIGGVLRGLVSPWEISGFIHGNDVSLTAMNAELIDVDLQTSIPQVEIPVVLFEGRHDHHVDSAIAADYLERLRAPYKSLIWFEHSAHDVPFEEPEAFNAELIRAVAEASKGDDQ